MTCYSPNVVVDGGVKPNGKRNLIWKYQAGAPTIGIPCAKCVGCNLDYSYSWMCRCVLEASLYDRNCFVTLTYNDKFLPNNRSLDHTIFQKFMHDLRREYGSGIRYFMCGEYGGKLGRPHYHSLLFNFDFADKVLFSVRNGERLCRSDSLERLWPNGFSSVGTVSVKSASYVARYSLKKVRGKDSVSHYVDKRTGEVLAPEYTRMSNRPGIGAKWFERFQTDVYPSDEVVLNGVARKPPRFFDKCLEKVNPQLLDEIKAERMLNIPPFEEGTFERLRVREQCKLAQVSNLKRSLEG